MNIKNALASLAVKDLRLSSHWYQNLLGKPADSTPMDEVAEWQFQHGGWLQLYQSTDRIGLGSVTLAVEDLEQLLVELEKLGICPGTRMDNDRVKLVMIKDPDGNSIALAQTKNPGMAQ